MTILEQFIKGKKQNPELCEDGLFINDNFIAVIDGVTSKSNTLFNGKAGGRAAMEKTKEFLSTADADSTPEQLFNGINDAVRGLYDGTPTGEAAVFAVIYNIKQKKIQSIGDCQYLINGIHHTDEKIFDKIVGDARALALELARLDGESDENLLSNDIGREFIMPLLKKQHLLANSSSKYGFAVLNGTPFDTSKILTFDVKENDTIIMASDGYPEIFDTLEKTEERLKEIINKDPLCDTDFISTKGIVPGNTSFDDRTYIKFTV